MAGVVKARRHSTSVSHSVFSTAGSFGLIFAEDVLNTDEKEFKAFLLNL